MTNGHTTASSTKHRGISTRGTNPELNLLNHLIGITGRSFSLTFMHNTPYTFRVGSRID